MLEAFVFLKKAEEQAMEKAEKFRLRFSCSWHMELDVSITNKKSILVLAGNWLACLLTAETTPSKGWIGCSLHAAAKTIKVSPKLAPTMCLYFCNLTSSISFGP